MTVTPGTFGTLCLRASTVATAFLTSIVLARLLGTDGYGLYAYVMAWVGLLVIPAMLGLDRLVVKEVAAAKAREEWGLVRGIASWSRRTVLVLSCGIGIVACLVAMLIGREGTSLVFAAAILALPFSALSGVYQAADRRLRVDHALCLPLRRHRLVPESAAVLPDEGIDLSDRVIEHLGRLKRDAVEVVVERLARQLFASGSAKELGEVAHHVPVGVIHLLGCARQLVAILLHESGLLAFVTEQIGPV